MPCRSAVQVTLPSTADNAQTEPPDEVWESILACRTAAASDPWLSSGSPTVFSPSAPRNPPLSETAAPESLTVPESLGSLGGQLSEIIAEPPQTELPDLSTPYASDSDASSAASSSTSSFNGGAGFGAGRFGNWRRPSSSRKRRAEDSASCPPPVSIRSQSWGSDAGSIVSTTPKGLGEPLWTTSNYDAGSSFRPSSDLPASLDAHRRSPSVSPRDSRSSPPLKRRKSVSETASASDTGEVTGSPFSPSWTPSAPPLARSRSDPAHDLAEGSAAGPSRQGPFSLTGMPKPPRLRSVSAYVSPTIAPHGTVTVPSTSTPFTHAPVMSFATSPVDRSSTSVRSPTIIRPVTANPPLSQSLPNSDTGSSLAEGSRSQRASRTPSIPVSLPASIGSSSLDAGLNPVVEVNTEWVPIRPRIRTAIRRKLERRRTEVPRVEHVLEDSRPPPVIPVVEKAAKKLAKAKDRRRAKARSSSSASELEGTDAIANLRRTTSRAKSTSRRSRRGKSLSTSAPSSDEDGYSDDVEEAKPFEHGPTELPPRRECFP